MTAGQSSDQSRSRRESRERAVELAYEAEVRGWSVDELVEAQTIPLDDFVVTLLRQAEDRRAQAEELIQSKSTRWAISRMPVLDVVVMRIAIAELLADTTPTGVVLSEAVELAGRYSTDESSRFVNGILAAVAADIRT
ncbi:MAG: transcription antitermination factor NusB [Acidimicrobiales bacterium]